MAILNDALNYFMSIPPIYWLANQPREILIGIGVIGAIVLAAFKGVRP